MYNDWAGKDKTRKKLKKSLFEIKSYASACIWDHFKLL